MSQNSVSVGLDIGTTKVTALIGKINNDRTITYAGFGECSSLGMRKGCIVDINNSMKSIEQAIHLAQEMAGIKVESVYVNTISDPIEFSQKEDIVNLTKSLNRIGIGIREMVLSPVAAAEAVLSSEEKQKGAVLLDIGGGTTGYAVYNRKKLLSAGVIPVGGGHITADLSFGLRISSTEAEKAKIEYGCVLPDIVSEYDFIKVGTGSERRKVSRKLLANIIQPRVEEILSLVKKAVYEKDYPKGNPVVVITGGTSYLPGLEDLATKVFGWPAQISHDDDSLRTDDNFNRPSLATGMGLVKYGARYFQPTVSKEINRQVDNGVLLKFKKWLREYI